MHFVRDPRTRFELALECGNLDIAVETAKTIDQSDCWSKLGAEALRQGNFKVNQEIKIQIQTNKQTNIRIGTGKSMQINS